MIHSTLASRRLALRPVALAVALLAAGGSALAQTQAAAPVAAAEASLPSVTVSAGGLQLGAGEMTNFRNMVRCCFADNALYLPILWQGDIRIGIQASLIDWKNKSLISLLNGRDLNVKRPPPGFVLHLWPVNCR